jgi:hypothetical protein
LYLFNHLPAGAKPFHWLAIGDIIDRFIFSAVVLFAIALVTKA